MNWKCFLIGHKEGQTDDAFGNCYCRRCAMHSYYDSHYPHGGPKWWNSWEFVLPEILRLAKVRWWYFKEGAFYRCHDCKKLETRFWRRTGDHSNCLPF